MLIGEVCTYIPGSPKTKLCPLVVGNPSYGSSQRLFFVWSWTFRVYSFFIFADQAIFWGGEKMRRGFGSILVDFGCSDSEVSYQRMRGVWNGRLEHLQCSLGRCTSTQHQVQTSEGRVEFSHAKRMRGMAFFSSWPQRRKRLYNIFDEDYYLPLSFSQAHCESLIS